MVDHTDSPTQMDLFPDSIPSVRATPRPPVLYAKAKARRQTVQRLTLKGKKVREIAAATGLTMTRVLSIRADLRREGRIPATPRAPGRTKDS